MTIEGTIVSKEGGLSASFGGKEQPYVRCEIARLDDPRRHAQARIVGIAELDIPVGGHIRLEVTRAITDRREGIVRFDCVLLPDETDNQSTRG